MDFGPFWVILGPTWVWGKFLGLIFAFVFFDKIFGVLAEKSSIPAMLAVWLPNIAFGILAIYLLRNAKR